MRNHKNLTNIDSQTFIRCSRWRRWPTTRRNNLPYVTLALPAPRNLAKIENHRALAKNRFLTHPLLCHINEMHSANNNARTVPIASPNAIMMVEKLTIILTMLRKIIADQGCLLRANPTLVGLAWTRVGFLLRRFCALATNPPQPARSKTTRPHRVRQPGQQGRAVVKLISLPRSRFWLHRLLPGHLVPCAASQLRHLIETPDMTALISTTPQLGRVLRPLCHTLGITLPAYLRLPPRPRKPSTHSLTKPTTKPRPKPRKHIFAPPTPPALERSHMPRLPGHRYANFFPTS